jgi:hypothetical protein
MSIIILTVPGTSPDPTLGPVTVFTKLSSDLVITGRDDDANDKKSVNESLCNTSLSYCTLPEQISPC